MDRCYLVLYPSMPNATFIKKQIQRKTDMDDPFFEETVSDISESDDPHEELEDITENVESLGTQRL